MKEIADIKVVEIYKQVEKQGSFHPAGYDFHVKYKGSDEWTPIKRENKYVEAELKEKNA